MSERAPTPSDVRVGVVPSDAHVGAVPSDARVGAVIVNYRTPDLALRSAAALAGERRWLPTLRLIVADGGSGDDSAQRIAAGLLDPAFAGWARPLALAINGGFGWANNQATLTMLAGPEPPDFIYLVNPDAIVEPGALARLVAAMAAEPRAAAVGSRLLNQDGSPAGAAFLFPTIGRELARGARTGALERLLGIRTEVDGSGEADWVTGASVLLRVAALREIGLFDTGFFLYFEETELMWRLRAGGWRVRHAPESLVRHVGGAATGLGYARRDLEVAPPLPRYWFESRRRFFALTRGRGYALAASVAWLAGHAVFLARRLAGGSRSQIPVEREARDLLRAGLWPRTRDSRRAPVPADEPPGRPAAWMNRKGS